MSEQKIRPEDNTLQKSEGLVRKEIKGIIEALLFATQRPLSVKEIKEIIEIEDAKVIHGIIDEIKRDCLESNRSFKLIEIAGGFQFTTDPVYAKWLRKLYKISRSDYLTRPSLETLSIIAYKQPVTKAEIEFIRGVNIDGVVKNLLQKGLLRISGKKKVIGSPYLYSTTRFFLQYFGLNSLDDLPQLPEFQEADIELGDEMLVENEPGSKEQNGSVQDETQKDTPKD